MCRHGARCSRWVPPSSSARLPAVRRPQVAAAVLLWRSLVRGGSDSHRSGVAVADDAPAAAPPMPTKMTEGATSPLPDPAVEKAAQDGKKWEAGRWVLPDGSPTYNVERAADNTDAVKKVDWMTYSGWRRYHAECHVCHGPNAEGSSFAPALKDSLKTMDYAKFLQVVASGQIRDVAGTKYIMPALGDNKNVMCYVDDLYVYLRAARRKPSRAAASAPTSAQISPRKQLKPRSLASGINPRLSGLGDPAAVPSRAPPFRLQRPCSYSSKKQCADYFKSANSASYNREQKGQRRTAAGTQREQTPQ